MTQGLTIFGFLLLVIGLILGCGPGAHLWNARQDLATRLRALLRTLLAWFTSPRPFWVSATVAGLFYLLTLLIPVGRSLLPPQPWVIGSVFLLSALACIFTPYWTLRPRPSLHEPWRLQWSWSLALHLTLHILLSLLICGNLLAWWWLTEVATFIGGIVAVGYLTVLLCDGLPELQPHRTYLLLWLYWLYLAVLPPQTVTFLAAHWSRWLTGMVIIGPLLMFITGARIRRHAAADRFTAAHVALFALASSTGLAVTYQVLSLVLLGPGAAFSPGLFMQSLSLLAFPALLRTIGAELPHTLLTGWVILTYYYKGYFCKWCLDSYMGSRHPQPKSDP